MQKTIAVAELGDRLGAVLDDVVRAHVPYVLTRGGGPEGVLVPYDEFERFQRFRETEVLRRFDRLMDHMRTQNADVDDDEIAQDVAAARSEIR